MEPTRMLKDGKTVINAKCLTAKGIGRTVAMAASLAAVPGGGFAAAAVAEGAPRPWQLGFQPAATPTMAQLEGFHNGFLLPLITVISLFVLSLLIYVMVRFNKRANPTPSKTSHNTLIEVVWTVIPVLILVAIAIPSFRLLFFQSRIPPSDLTIKAIASTWKWDYEYPDHGDISFAANLVPDDELRADQPRLLATDYEVVVPVNKVVQVIVTSSDLIHAWAVPAFGVKIDAVPGRLNETWFKAEREGIYYGQCSELCGMNHAYMPIQIRVVSEALFDAWVTAAKDDIDAAAALLSAADQEPQEQTKLAGVAKPNQAR